MEFKGGCKHSVLQKGLETREVKERTQGRTAIDQAGGKTRLELCRVWAFSGPIVPPYQMPCVDSGLITVPGSAGALCHLQSESSQLQAWCLFYLMPSCDRRFCLTRCRERTQDWRSANLASCLSPAPCVTLYKSFKWSASIWLRKMWGWDRQHFPFGCNFSYQIRLINIEIVKGPKTTHPSAGRPCFSVTFDLIRSRIRNVLFKFVRHKISITRIQVHIAQKSINWAYFFVRICTSS